VKQTKSDKNFHLILKNVIPKSLPTICQRWKKLLRMFRTFWKFDFIFCIDCG